MSESNFNLCRLPQALARRASSGGPIAVLDEDALGAGGIWVQELRELTRGAPLALFALHFAHFKSHPIYLAALEEFVSGFKPEQLFVSKEELSHPFLSRLGCELRSLEPQNLLIGHQSREDLRRLLEIYFPKTLAELGDLKQGVISAFLDTAGPDKHWLLAERLRSFSMFLKERFPELPPDLAQMVFWEWSHLELQFVEVGSPRPKVFAGKLGLNQSLRFLEFRNPRFNEPGLWALYIGEDKLVRNINLRPREALTIDLIKEDRAFEVAELAHLLSIYDPLLPMSAREANDLIQKLLDRELLYLCK